MNELATLPHPDADTSALAPVDSESVGNYKRRSKAGATQRAYRAAWRESELSGANAARAKASRRFPTFEAFCAGRGYASLPASAATVSAYLAHLADAGAKLATVEQRRAAVAFAHRGAGVVDPCADEAVRAVMSGIRKSVGRGRGKDALRTDDLRRMVAAIAADAERVAAGADERAAKAAHLKAVRDVAIVLTGFMGAFRRSELAALVVSDVVVRERRIGGQSMHVLTIEVQRSKTDQDGKGATKTIPGAGGDLDAVAALRAWLGAAGIASGALFRGIDQWGNVKAGAIGGQDVSDVVKRAAALAGLNPAQYGAHSMRRGFVTVAAEAGISLADIQEQTGHRSVQTVTGYIEKSGVGAARAVMAVTGA